MTPEKPAVDGKTDDQPGTYSHLLGVNRCGNRWGIIPPHLIPALKTSRAFRVYAALAMHANKSGRCWPAMKTLETLTGLDRRSVQRTLNEMELGAVMLTFPRQGHKLVNIYELQPDPGAYCEERRTEESGPGGYIASIVYTLIDCLSEREGVDVGARLRMPGERNEIIDRQNADRDGRPLLTPGIKLFVRNPDRLAQLSESDRWGALAQLEGLEGFISNGMLPWSLLAAILEQVQQERKPAQVAADKTTAMGSGQNVRHGWRTKRPPKLYNVTIQRNLLVPTEPGAASQPPVFSSSEREPTNAA